MIRSDYGALLASRPEELAPDPGPIRVVAAATDFTTAATMAVRRAAQLARTHRARLALMHVAAPACGVAAAVLDVFRTRGLQSTGAALSRLREAAARIVVEFDVPVDIHLASGRVSKGIAALAQAAQADLIVLGNSQRNFLKDLLGIHAARRVRRMTTIPVLAVSQPLQRVYSRGLFVADLTPAAAYAARIARRLAPGSMFMALHSFSSPYDGMLALANASPEVLESYRDRAAYEAMQRLSSFTRDAQLGEDVFLHVHPGHPVVGVRTWARELDVDFVVLSATSSWLTEGIKDGVMEQLVADPPCDLLLVTGEQPLIR